MRKIPLIVPFLLALFVHLYGMHFFSPLRLLAFAPFLALVFQRLSLGRSLWIAALVGLFIDLSTASTRWGLFAWIYAFAAWIAFKQRSQFFEDKPLAFSLYTAFISCLISALQLSALTLGKSRLALDFSLVSSSLILMPLIDGLYAFLWFTCPLQVYSQVRRFWLLRKR